jgi:dsRNA-specific ribonuclease
LGTDKGLDRCVQLGNGQSAVSTKMMATTVEALVGAAYLDSGEGGIAAAGGIAQNLGIAYQRPAV